MRSYWRMTRVGTTGEGGLASPTHLQETLGALLYHNPRENCQYNVWPLIVSVAQVVVHCGQPTTPAGAGRGPTFTGPSTESAGTSRRAMALSCVSGRGCEHSGSAGWCRRGHTRRTCPPSPPRASGGRGGTDSADW